VCSNKKTQCETGPVVDITHQSKRKHKIHEAEDPHKEGEFKKTGDKTYQKSCPHPEIHAPFDNLHIHENHIRLSYSRVVLKNDGTDKPDPDSVITLSLVFF
jgi:hypothetical protein